METYYFSPEADTGMPFDFSPLTRRNLYSGLAVIFANSWEPIEAIDPNYFKRIHAVRIGFAKYYRFRKTRDYLWELTLTEAMRPRIRSLTTFLVPLLKDLVMTRRQQQKDHLDLERTRSDLEMTIRDYRIAVYQLRSDAEAKLKEAQAQLVQSAKLAALGAMTSGIAHELNNPLYLIQGFAKQLDKLMSDANGGGSLDLDKAQDFLAEIHNNGQRMSSIVQHFREFSRQADRNFVFLDLNDVVDRSLHLLQEQMRLSSIEVILKSSAVPLMTLGNPNRLEQVLVNLLSNARDEINKTYGAAGGKIEIETLVDDEGIYLVVQDTGGGVTDEVKQKMFDPFFTTKDVGKGTGLGLSISHQIIVEHKGRIFCETGKWGGAQFTVKLQSVTNSKDIQC